jgi:prepilin-type N-terminal cleavage/methylation domain-containing protein
MSRRTEEGKTRPIAASPGAGVRCHETGPPGVGHIVVGMQRGVTLVELLIVITLAGTLLLFAVPSLGALRDRVAVETAASGIVAAHARARIIARAERRLTILALTLDSVVVRVVEGPVDTLERWRGAGPRAYGVETAGFPRSILFAPSGVTMGVANASYVVARGTARKEVVVSRYGRVRMQ